MRSLPLYVAWFVVAIVVGAAPSSAAEADSKSLTVTATIGSRTSLKVSTQLLQFEVDAPGHESIAIVEFSAGARTHHGGEVVLTVEPMRATAGPGGAADVETALTFSGQGDGTLAGVLQPMSPSVASRWTGSGFRTGRMTFALRASAAGSYSVPVRFVLTAP